MNLLTSWAVLFDVVKKEPAEQSSAVLSALQKGTSLLCKLILGYAQGTFVLRTKFCAEGTGTGSLHREAESSSFWRSQKGN